MSINQVTVYQDIRDVAEIAVPGTKADPEYGNGLAVVCIKTKKISYHQTEVLSTAFVNSMDPTIAVCQILGTVKSLMKKHDISPMADIVFRVKIPEHLVKEIGKEHVDVAYDQLDAMDPSVSDSIVNAILNNELNHAAACVLLGKKVPESFIKSMNANGE